MGERIGGGSRRDWSALAVGEEEGGRKGEGERGRRSEGRERKGEGMVK